MNRKQAGIGLGVGVAAFVGLIALSGQYVPPTSTTPALTTGGGLVITGGKVGLTTSCAVGERLEWDGSAWQCRRFNDYTGTYLEWHHEFIATAGTDWEAGGQSGTGASGSVIVTSTAGRPGIVGLSTGTDSNGSARRRSNTSHLFSAYASAVYTAILSLPILSTSGERFAVLSGYLSGDGSVAPAHGCWFSYDEGNAMSGGCNTSNLHKLQAVSSDGSTRTRVLLDGTSQDGACSAGAITTCSTTVAAVSGDTTGWLNLRVVITGTSSCAFYVNGTLCATLTTNLPSASRSLSAGTTIIKSVGSTAREVDLDAHRLRLQLNAARSP